MRLRQAVFAFLAGIVPATASAQVWFRPVEPFHLQPIAPASGLLFETRPVIFDYGDPRFGMGWLVEGRLALLERRLHFALGLPWGFGFVPHQSAAQLGNVDFGAGYGAPIGTGGGRWGFGGRLLIPTGRNGPGAYAAWASRPYNFERHFRSADGRAYADIGIDNGSFVGQLEGGFDFWIPPGPASAELIARFGGLIGVHLAPRTILMLEVTWYDALTAPWNGQLSLEPGIRFGASRDLDLAFYLTIPADDDLVGDAFALGFQLLWNPT